MNAKFSPTPFGTYHVTVVVPRQDVGQAKRLVAQQARKLGCTKRLSIREHEFGGMVSLGMIYPKGK